MSRPARKSWRVRFREWLVYGGSFVVCSFLVLGFLSWFWTD